MGELAVAYRVLCRHQEALAMNEQALKFMRRVLPENHPDISMMFLLTSCYHLCIYIFVFRSLHDESFLDVLYTWAAPRCSGDGGEGA